MEKKSGIYYWVRQKKRWFKYATLGSISIAGILTVSDLIEIFTGENLRTIKIEEYRNQIIVAFSMSFFLVCFFILLSIDFNSYMKSLIEKYKSNAKEVGKLNEKLLEIEEYKNLLEAQCDIQVSEISCHLKFLERTNNKNIKKRFEEFQNSENRREELETQSLHVEYRRRAVSKMKESK